MKLTPLTGLSIITLLAVSCNHNSQNQVNLHSPEELKKRELYNLAEDLYGTRSDSAFYYFNKIVSESSDSILRSSALTYMGIIQYDLGDYFGSQDSYLQSQQLLRNGDSTLFENFAANYNGLGQSSRMLKNYEEAIEYFNQAILFSTDIAKKLTRINNKATTLKDLKLYGQAISLYTSIQHSTNQSPKEYARVLSNLGNTKWLQDSNYNAAPELLKALDIREREQDKWGLTASYRHLCDYYIARNNDSALFYAKQLQRIASDLNSADDERDALTRLISLSPSAQGKAYFRRFLYLTDSIQTSRNNDKNQFAPIRYGVAKQKEANLTLQKENAENQLRVIWLQIGSVILIIVTVIGFVWYRRRKRQAIKEQQLRISQKVHDKVANRVYRIMSEVEHQGLPEQSVLLYKLDAVYKQSRDISYDHSEANIQDAQQSVKELIESFASESTRIASVGNSKELWAHISPAAQEELSVVLEELLTNMKKHSGASNVVIKFMQKDNCIEMNYSDDGIGFSHETGYGNGLRNTETRIKSIGGSITFDKSKPGLKIRMTIPIDK